jgi:hypothetical protein
LLDSSLPDGGRKFIGVEQQFQGLMDSIEKEKKK